MISDVLGGLVIATAMAVGIWAMYRDFTRPRIR